MARDEIAKESIQISDYVENLVWKKNFRKGRGEGEIYIWRWINRFLLFDGLCGDLYLRRLQLKKMLLKSLI